MSYAIYLRKSQADLEAEASGVGETLSRHRRTLLELAKRYNIKGADALIEKAVGVVSRYEDYARQAGVDGYWLQKIKEETGCRIENMSETVRHKDLGK